MRVNLQIFEDNARAIHPQILHDYGQYRHIYLDVTAADGSKTQCDITTLPRQLSITTTKRCDLSFKTDKACYVFSSMPDMFSQFRQEKMVNSINPAHWAKFLFSGEPTQWEPRHVTQVVNDAFSQWLENCAGDELIAQQWERLSTELLPFVDDEHEFTKLLRGWMPDRPGILIHDIIDPDSLKPYSHHFIWSCNAIAIAIREYDIIRERLSRLIGRPGKENYCALITKAPDSFTTTISGA